MSEFKQYRRKQIAEMRPFVLGENLDALRVSITAVDFEAGSPKPGDMIARNPKNHADMWLVAAQYFADNFEPEMPPLFIYDPATGAVGFADEASAVTGDR